MRDLVFHSEHTLNHKNGAYIKPDYIDSDRLCITLLGTQVFLKKESVKKLGNYLLSIVKEDWNKEQNFRKEEN